MGSPISGLPIFRTNRNTNRNLEVENDTAYDLHIKVKLYMSDKDEIPFDKEKFAFDRADMVLEMIL